MDDPNQNPYEEKPLAIWKGLNILNYAFAPHYKSDHKESEDVDKYIEYMINNKIPFKALRDGDIRVMLLK